MPDFKKEEKTNKALWNELTPVHFKSYGVDRFLNGETTLDSIQLTELGDVRGKTLLHLQCHFGLDTMSWAREGAISTGVDFSEESIKTANELRNKAGLESVRFINSNIYDLPNQLDEKFDIVYTSQGVLCWLKDINEWARIIRKYLNPGGIFYIMESHPFSMIFDDEREDFRMIPKYKYFSKEPICWPADFPDYSDGNYYPENPSYEWMWTISDIVNALVTAGLKIEFVNEFDKLFYKAFPGMKKDEDGWWYLPDYRDIIPLMFTIKAKG